MTDFTFNKFDFLAELGLSETNKGCFDGENWIGSAKPLVTLNPTNNKPIASVTTATEEEYELCVQNMQKAFEMWSDLPAPKRGEILNDLKEEFIAKKEPLGKLVSLEMGKILSEGLGEVQETIDILEYAVGLSRTISGTIIPSERQDHVIFETWNPLGIVGVITAFNFPNAVFGWNAALALMTGNVVMWKAASTVPLVAVATTKILETVFKKHSLPKGLVTLVIGPGRTIGEKLITDERINLVSFTGSTQVGKHVSEVVHKDFRSTILECGGNNAIIVCEDADLDLALRAILFASVGTAGQRCTTTRRLILQDSIYESFLEKLTKAYKTIPIGDPLEKGTIMGPLHEPRSVENYLNAIESAKKEGGKVLYGGKKLEKEGNFVEPTIIAIDHKAKIVHEETFAPILYVFPFENLEEAIKINNEVPQGLSSSIFTNDMRKMFKWIGPKGSDCGLININIPTSGAEIGGAFGGNKETGGGRESGSDSWKQYCRRGTCTINYGTELPLAQGIKFGEN
ncbi:alpha-aminoadipic semialdehyde dehydrogenase [Anaeramoeba flamelloides]|uniref:aldehyde dehydrogenase (NAD(+)) n=1 Tax=Anaeramoeba flamelloides TaxID=1746091 RepID=A0AAV7ZNQ3_9EUKA|nr:alpha-aminoadipic semialdehyde dehydrogenase [Anaeramoeba flamelloides]KAJ6242472.1 alpha-aminoadipic semialdehyde dehydrogenase [Anaeramoeba flamelloides]